MELIVTRKKFKEYRKDSWHYQLTRYAFGRLADKFCRVCLHWSLLVPAAAIIGSLRFITVLLFWVGLRLISIIGYYPWITLAWLTGCKPRYWRWLRNSVWNLDEGLCIQRYEADPRNYSKERRGLYWHRRKLRRWPLLYIAPMAGAAVLIVIHFGTSATGVSALLSLAWYWTAVAIYFSLVGLIALVHGYRRTLLPYMKRFYFAVCPEIKWVDAAEEVETQQAA